MDARSQCNDVLGWLIAISLLSESAVHSHKSEVPLLGRPILCYLPQPDSMCTFAFLSPYSVSHVKKKTMRTKMTLVCCLYFCLVSFASGQDQKPKLIHVLKGHRGLVYALVFSPDGRLLVSSGENTRLWDAVTGKMIRLLYDGPMGCSLAFSAGGKMLATDCILPEVGHSIWVWDAATWKKIHSLRTGIHALATHCEMAFQPDGRTLVSSLYDPRNGKRIIFWDVATGKKTRIVQVDTGEAEPGRGLFLAFSPDCRLFAMRSHAKDRDIISLYETTTGKKLVVMKGKRGDYIRGATFSPNGKIIAAGIDDAMVQLWDVATGKPATVFHGSKNPWPVNVMAFSPDGKTLAFGVSTEEPGIELWDVTTGKKRNSFKVRLHDRIGATCMAFSPDGTILAVGRAGHEEWDETIELWNIGSPHPVEHKKGMSREGDRQCLK